MLVNFGVLPKRPEPAFVKGFFENNVRMDMTDVKAIQFNNVKNCVVLLLTDRETTVKFAKKYDGRHVMAQNGVAYKIPFILDDGCIEVRVHDFPPEMSNNYIIDELEKFGSILYIRNEKWKFYFPGMRNGVRSVRMILNKPIPSSLTIANGKTLVTYKGQPQTCRLCDKLLHPDTNCSGAKKRLSQNTQWFSRTAFQ